MKLGREVPYDYPTGTLLPGSPSSSSGPRIAHVAYYTDWNAGDTLLTAVLRDLVMDQCGPVRWTGMHAHQVVTPEDIRYVNRSDGLIIGGGGLFLRDTNPNALSGWQWSCSVDSLTRMRRPIAVFAVGYNRFRNQPDFEPVFRDHLTLLVEKSAFFGLRNSGSIRAVREYLPASLRSKVRYQPCMTTLMAGLYPEHMAAPTDDPPFVALNCAFDRSELRFGHRKGEILEEIAEAMWRISRHFPVKFYSHSPSDDEFLPYLERRGVPFEHVALAHVPADRLVDLYRRPALVIGMRGHAQMIPFGCARPVISLVSHDKLRWFLEDTGHEEWGIEVQEPDLADRLADLSFAMLNQPEAVRAELLRSQERLWDVTVENLGILAGAFGLDAPRGRPSFERVIPRELKGVS